MDPILESVYYCFEFQAIDVHGRFLLGPCSRYFHIVHMGAPTLFGGICIYGHIRVKKFEGNPRC
jgi:hypothetical protein